MKTDTAPQTKYLKDYMPPDFKVDRIFLTFDLRPGKTTVTAKTVFTRINPAAKNLKLDGQRLVLKSISIDNVRLPESAYLLDEDHLTLLNVPDHFTLDVINEIHPEQNTALEGLYSSGGNYCTQCEPEGFRKITYYLDRPDVMTTYTTRIEADKKLYPILLSNGNCIDTGDLPDGRHYSVWEDPFVKPSYLFALVAGNLAHIEDTFTTMSGKKVNLYIYVNHGNEDKCQHAMLALKNSMKWDEQKYGREYDLEIFNIVAVNDFNFGAMENKSLNIFNARLVLAKPQTATDGDYDAIESVVAHEYFHNWTGNRITCRDWFQLSLKEGLTVFRDQEFSADMNDRAVQRIADVESLRNRQFAEDASPMAHPIRPDNYIEINNFYTATVYEKGAEIIRMFHTLLGAENYRKATDLYFERHDGQAVTCDDFVKCMEDATGADFTQFKLWYAQAGTPEIKVTSRYDASKEEFALTFHQHIPVTPGQDNKKSMHIPVAIGLLDKNGKDLLPEGTRILNVTEAEQTFLFGGMHEKPVASILRGFSAPVKLETDQSNEDLLFLMAHDTDGFNRWDAGQQYLKRLIFDIVDGKTSTVPQNCVDAFGLLIANRQLDRGLLAKALTLPEESYLAQFSSAVDVDGIHQARLSIMSAIGRAHQDQIVDLYRELEDASDYRPDPISIGKRRLRAILLRYLQHAQPDLALDLALQQNRLANNMSEQVAALSVLADLSGDARDVAFATFHTKWKEDPLVLDKWFALQGLTDREDTVDKVKALLAHGDFTYRNPNRLRTLVGSFSSNAVHFHRKDGAGYELLADVVITANGINPSVAARLLAPLRQWKRYDRSRQGLMEKALQRILAEKSLSPDVYEIASKSLNG